MPTQQFADDSVSGEATTRRMQPPDDWGARHSGNTAPQSRPDTNPVGKPPAAYQTPNVYQPPSAYQVPPAPPAWRAPQYAPATPAAAARGGSGWAIFLAIFLALILGAVIGGRMIFKRIRDRVQVATQQAPLAPSAEDVKTFPLSKGAAVSIQTVNGNITVTASDAPQAEVRIIANGATPADVTIRSDNNSLSLSAPPGKGRISFEVKLPRELGNAVFNSTNGSVAISDIAGQLTVETTNGKIKLDQVSGIDRARSVNGGIDATLRQREGVKDRPMTFETVNGGIDLRLQDDFNGTLDASTVHGGINVDEAFGDVKVEKSFPTGSRASGNIGAGGPTVTAKTMNGGIKIHK